MREWNRLLDSRTDRTRAVAAIRADMDRGDLANRHLTDTELVTAVRRMELVAKRLPRDPGEASTRLLEAMGL